MIFILDIYLQTKETAEVETEKVSAEAKEDKSEVYFLIYL